MPTPVGAASPRPLAPPSFNAPAISSPPVPSRSGVRSLGGPLPLERASAGSPEASVAARFVARQTTSAGTASVQAEATGPARDAQVQQQLDGVRARFSGPYRVAGQEVRTAPMFRMTDGFNAGNAVKHAGPLLDMCVKAGVMNAMRCVSGRGDPELLVRVTQVLIDNGKLPAGSEPVGDRIKQMQWEWGIGVDCAGYAFEAARSVHGAGRFPEASRPNGIDTSLRQMDKRPAEMARPGDIIHLDNLDKKAHGHNVVVFSSVTLDTAGAAALAGKLPAAKAFLAEAGPVVALEVDSSWGAGEKGDVSGGGRRDTWLFNTRTREWADFDPKTGEIHRSKVGPQDERPSGSFRPKGVL